MIRRIRDYDKKAPCRDAHKMYVVCEGEETEPKYFSFFQGRTSNLEVITIPPQSGTDPLKLMERAKAIFLDDQRRITLDYLHGDTVWFVIDTDTWEREGKILPLRDFCSRQNAEILSTYSEVKPYSSWNVAQSNPCFEIWLYYHIYKERPDEDEVEKADSFKEYLNSKIQGGFSTDRDPVFLERAIENAIYNFSRDEDGKVSLFSTEMYLAGQEVLKFLKPELDKLKNKLG